MANNTIDGMKRRTRPASSVGVEGIATVRRKVSTGAKAPAEPSADESKTKTREEVKMTTKRKKKQTRADFLEPVGGFDMDLSDEDIKPEKKKGKKGWKIFRRGLLVILILAIIGGIVAYFWGDAIISKLTGGRSGLGDLIGAVVSDKHVELKKDANGRTNVLVFGTSGYTMEDEEHDGAGLTDSIMVVSFDQESKDLAMINIPRDLYQGNTCTATGKINEVYWCNNLYDEDEDGGAAALEEAVSNVLGIGLQYYVHLDWGALVQVVDALGGITVTVDEDIADYGWTNVVMQAGVPTLLNGEEALGLARARHGTYSGDFTRAASQQKIMMAIKDRIVENGLGVTDAIGILNALGDNVRMDFNMDEVRTIYNIATTMDLSAMRSLSLLDQGDGTSLVTTDSFDPGYAGYAVSFVVPVAGRYNYKDIRAFTKKMLTTDPVIREDAVVLVLNGSGEYGVAGAEAAVLEGLGFAKVYTDDAPEGYWEGYKLYDVTGEAPGSLAVLAEKYGVTASGNVPPEIDSAGYDLILVVGTMKSE